jgi:hypothetical protein
MIFYKLYIIIYCIIFSLNNNKKIYKENIYSIYKKLITMIIILLIDNCYSQLFEV